MINIGKRKTHEEFVKQVYELVGDEYEVVGEYQSAKIKIKLFHKKCSNYIDMNPDDFLQGKRCKFCSHRSYKKTTEEFQEDIDKISKGNFKVIGEYINSRTDIDILDVHNNEIFTVKPNSFLHKGCLRSKSIVYTTENFKEKISIINPNIIILGEYINSITDILCRCAIDGNEWYTKPIVLIRGCGCPKCSGVYKRNENEFIEELSRINPDIEIVGEYKRIKKRLLVKCLKCNGEWNPVAQTLLAGYGCPYCSNQKILIGFNDMWTTNPELAKLLANSEDGYKYFQGSNKKIDFKCPNCGSVIKNKSISNVRTHGLSCNKCSDGISYPNKFMYNILTQLKINFTPEYCPKWIKSKRYDFYFKLNNREYIIEMDGGMGHGNYNTLSKMTAEESVALDIYKEELAIQHNIKVIRIDCIQSNLNYIKNNILNSELNNILNLNDLDWNVCNELSLNSFVKIACDLWNTNQYTIKDISNMMKLTTSTIVRYLKTGTEIGWCYYNSNDEKIKNIKNNAILNSKKIRCIETGIVYNSMGEASEYVHRSPKTISACCRGKNKTCGVSPDGIPVHWEYV